MQDISTAIRRMIRRGLTVVALSMTPVLLLSGTAQATQAIISGSTYSDANVWYLSTNYRTITTQWGGDVYIAFVKLPLLSNQTRDQIKWKLIGNDGSTWDNTTHYISQINQWYYLTNKPTGWQFRNKYARYTTCQVSGCNHDFEGEQDY